MEYVILVIVILFLHFAYKKVTFFLEQHLTRVEALVQSILEHKQRSGSNRLATRLEKMNDHQR